MRQRDREREKKTVKEKEKETERNTHTQLQKVSEREETERHTATDRDRGCLEICQLINFVLFQQQFHYLGNKTFREKSSWVCMAFFIVE